FIELEAYEKSIFDNENNIKNYEKVLKFIDDKQEIISQIDNLKELNKSLSQKVEVNKQYIDKFNKELVQIHDKILNLVTDKYIIKLMNEIDNRININNYKHIKPKIDKKFNKKINKLKNNIRYYTKKYSKNHFKVKKLKLDFNNEIIKYNKLNELYDYKLDQEIKNLLYEYNNLIDDNYKTFEEEYKNLINKKLIFKKSLKRTREKIKYLNKKISIIFNDINKNYSSLNINDDYKNIIVFRKEEIILKTNDNILSYEYKLTHKYKDKDENGNIIYKDIVINIFEKFEYIYFNEVYKLIKEKLNEMEQFKIQFEMLVLFCGSYNTYEAMMYSTRLFRSTIKIFNSKELLNDDDKLKKYISTLFKELYTCYELMEPNEFSNFYIESYLDLRIKINRTQPKIGSSYIDLPPQLKNKKCIINVKNNDNLCIIYAIATHLYLKD